MVRQALRTAAQINRRLDDCRAASCLRSCDETDTAPAPGALRQCAVPRRRRERLRGGYRVPPRGLERVRRAGISAPLPRRAAPRRATAPADDHAGRLLPRVLAVPGGGVSAVGEL